MIKLSVFIWRDNCLERQTAINNQQFRRCVCPHITVFYFVKKPVTSISLRPLIVKISLLSILKNDYYSICSSSLKNIILFVCFLTYFINIILPSVLDLYSLLSEGTYLLNSFRSSNFLKYLPTYSTPVIKVDPITFMQTQSII